VRVNNVRHPFSINASPMAEARCDFPPPGLSIGVQTGPSIGVQKGTTGAIVIG